MAKRSTTRNAQGGGSIRQRKDGRWEARYTVGRDPGTGKQIQKSIYGATQKEVRQKLQQVCTDINNGIFTEPSKLTVATWFDIWLTEYNGNVKPNTRKAYEEKTRNYIKPALGAVKLSALTSPMVQKFVNSLKEETKEHKALSSKTIKCAHGVLHKGLQQAALIGYLRFNPADNCALPRMEQREVKPLEQDEIGMFLEVIRGDRFESLFLVDLFTGLRQGEILGLTWDNIDFNKKTIYVCHQLQRGTEKGSGYSLTSLKNNKTRKITAADTVIEILWEHRKRQFEERERAADRWVPDIPNLVFTNEFGGHLTPVTVWKHFHELIGRAGITGIRFHDLRHTYAVSSLQAGDDIKTVQENLGHHAAAFTMDVYGHVTEAMKVSSAERMENYIQTFKNGKRS